MFASSFGKPSPSHFSGGMSTLGQTNTSTFGGNTGSAFGSTNMSGGIFGSGTGLLRSSPNQSGGTSFGGGNNSGFGGFQSQTQGTFGSPQTVNPGFGSNAGGFGSGNRGNLSVNTQSSVGFGSQMGGGTFGGGISNTGNFGNRLTGSPGMGQSMGTSGFGMNNTMSGSGFGNQMNTFGNQSSPAMGVRQPTPIGTAQYNSAQATVVLKDTVKDSKTKKVYQVDCPFYHICAPRNVNEMDGFASKSQEELRWEDIQMKNGNMNPPQYGNAQQSMGLGGNMGGLSNVSRPGGFGSTGFGQTATNQQSTFGGSGLGLSTQQSLNTGGFGGTQQSSNTGGFGGFSNTSGGLGAGGGQPSGFGTSGGFGTNTQSSPFGGGAPNTGFGVSAGLGQSSGTTGNFGGFGSSIKQSGFGGLGGSNTQTSSPGFGTGTSRFGTGTATGFNTGATTSTSSLGIAASAPTGFGSTPSNTTSLGASTLGTTGPFGTTATTGTFGGFGNASPAGGSLGLGNATNQSGFLGNTFGAKPGPSSATTPSFNFGLGGATSQTAAPSTGFGATGSLSSLGTGALGTGATTLGSGTFGNSLTSFTSGLGNNPTQQQMQQHQQQLSSQQQQQYLNPMISIKDKVTSLRSKAKKLNDAHSKDISSAALVPSKYNDHISGASPRGGLPMPMGTNARITPRGKQATTPLSNQKTLSSSMMSNVARASGSFTSPDAFMGRSVRRLVIDSSSISAGNDSWVNKLLPQRVSTPSDRPETVDSPEPWNNRMNGDERDTSKSPPGVEAWADVKYQDGTYDSQSNSPEQKFLPSPEAVRGNSGSIGSASKNINRNMSNNRKGGNNNDDDFVEFNPNAPKMTKPHYKLRPSMAVLKMMTDEELSCVRDFTIERRDETDHHSLLAEIEWLEPVDLRGVNLDDIVQMGHMEVAVYEDAMRKPLYGEELNKPCRVTLYRVLPKKNQTVEKALKSWRKKIENDGTKILSYDEYSKYDIDGPPIGRLIFQTKKWC